ncbi:uncharacterized protein B0H18DRAFT_514302 [Fomitopsis serialis]|uniref:uncharacterized protein n=1 Tax=Fomitopsis serialis TaxID=139415 RepID=UPI00200785F0|nr:uncharacterized protein B0H18DRAFT_514302 [Neoantrodia serialis]KAH9922516.1 hypothetical protein B0H18DRAFT_514302 [Neoantrodia serialis]
MMLSEVWSGAGANEAKRKIGTASTFPGQIGCNTRLHFLAVHRTLYALLPSSEKCLSYNTVDSLIITCGFLTSTGLRALYLLLCHGISRQPPAEDPNKSKLVRTTVTEANVSMEYQATQAYFKIGFCLYSDGFCAAKPVWPRAARSIISEAPCAWRDRYGSAAGLPSWTSVASHVTSSPSDPCSKQNGNPRAGGSFRRWWRLPSCCGRRGRAYIMEGRRPARSPP